MPRHRETAGRGHQERLCGGPSTGGAFGVVADEQERQDRRQFPERVEDQHVVAGHQAEHGTGERDHLGGEDAEAWFVVLEVAGAVHQDQRADAQHQHRHDRGEGVEPHVDVHRQAGHPLDAQALLGSPVRDDPAEAREGYQCEREERVASY